MFPGEIRRQRVSRMRGFRHWRWHLDEMYVKLNGEMVYLWRAVDQEGEILESYVTRTRDKEAAVSFMKKALKRHGTPEAITTDRLRSYGAAMAELGNSGKREVGRWANNRVENSHLPFRRRERAMTRFRRMKTLQKFASVHSSFHNHFTLERHLVDRQTYKERRTAGPGRVAGCHGLRLAPQSQSCANQRRVRIRLTAPPFQPWAIGRLGGSPRGSPRVTNDHSLKNGQ
jgi:putative transposase